ncbi:hypothetical protein BDV38DRAFT_67257 [Aspergillus pseudotamarii]|uniref:Uncharacterized protein n=1 Tax=Aspergillus pseudotamarii TaxID=132259 RepID=A0A5N6TAP5_ASPPS|nr:uncharacterized protein BDV38DRAFT_67257 [Aspergillus pseudotamarii]KAE8143445.1 hypothetical protein BDV38DRAFT_67257 [Aspergillus pseudotamarii]
MLGVTSVCASCSNFISDCSLPCVNPVLVRLCFIRLGTSHRSTCLVSGTKNQVSTLETESELFCSIICPRLGGLLQRARHIEALVCWHKIPAAEAPRSTGDDLTPVGHFQTLARAYQLSILLELYRMS